MKDEHLTEEELEELFNTGVMRKDLSALGERAVRDKLNRCEYGKPGSDSFAAVSAWLADAEFARLQEDSAKRDAREAATLAIASRANIIAIIAVAIAAIAAIVEAVDKIWWTH